MGIKKGKMNFSQGVLTNDPTSCAGYFMCVHDKLQPFTCQDGTHWDDTQKVVLQFELLLIHDLCLRYGAVPPLIWTKQPNKQTCNGFGSF